MAHHTSSRKASALLTRHHGWLGTLCCKSSLDCALGSWAGPGLHHRTWESLHRPHQPRPGWQHQSCVTQHPTTTPSHSACATSSLLWGQEVNAFVSWHLAVKCVSDGALSAVGRHATAHSCVPVEQAGAEDWGGLIATTQHPQGNQLPGTPDTGEQLSECPTGRPHS